MKTYTKIASGATAPNSSSPISNRRAAFAKDAVFAEFPARAARALDQADFKDHRPDRGPRPLGKIAAKVADDTGLKAVHHWVNEARRADSDEEREAALKIAGEIANLMGLDADLVGRRAA